MPTVKLLTTFGCVASLAALRMTKEAEMLRGDPSLALGYRKRLRI